VSYSHDAVLTVRSRFHYGNGLFNIYPSESPYYLIWHPIAYAQSRQDGLDSTSPKKVVDRVRCLNAVVTICVMGAETI
jgi:hypothetical protein